jgi:phosphonoacetaldehyde hydrolase
MKIQAAILDWAGTVVDHGSRAPMGAFVRAFAEFGVTISIANARGPMGMAKWDHFDSIEPNRIPCQA